MTDFSNFKRIAIVGSRTYPHLYEIQNLISQLPKDTTIISGGAKGVDYAAAQWAKHYGLAYEEKPADWAKLGKRAGYVRNIQIVHASDLVVAFWDGKSPGTKHTIDIARKAGKPVDVYTLGPEHSS